jgi:SAM-dependent methyltransferase
MTRFEKRFVNRESKGNRNITRLTERLDTLDLGHVKDALEIGCGVGFVAAFLADHYGWSVEGTDVDPEEVDIATSRYGENERLRFSVEDAARLSFPENRFDLVVSQNVFHHIPDWPKVVREVGRVLRPGGYLIWLDLYAPAALKALLKPFGKRHGIYTLDDVRSALAGSGLEDRFEKRVVHGPFPHREIVAQKA